MASSISRFIELAKSRLDEMDGAVAALESQMSDMDSTAREQAERAKAASLDWRDQLEKNIEEANSKGEAWLADGEKSAEENWRAAQTAFQSYANQASAGRDLYEAQAKAQILSWKKNLADRKAAAERATATDKAKMDMALEQLGTEVKATEARLAEMMSVATDQWQSHIATLDESRKKLEEAWKKTDEATPDDEKGAT